MNKNLLSAISLAVLATGSVAAQQLTSDYVKFPQSTQLHTYVSQWNGGAGTITVDGATWEDEEFFTSRVKPRTRIAETGVNLYDFGTKASRRSVWWVPVGEPGTQAIQNAVFDSEVFTMWSYLDMWGNWTAPFGWTTGAMADVAHKNGVAVHGVASIPNASISGDWNTSMSSIGSTYQNNADALGKFLYYHGNDGLGYNSEFSGGGTIVPQLIKVHKQLWTYMKDKNPIWEVLWYDGTNDGGSISFDSFLSGKTGIYAASSIFSNYNWASASSMSSAESRANGVNNPDGAVRGPWWNYAGMDQQGGQPRVTNGYQLLKDANWSMGWWGAHEHNMFWEGRNGGGSGADAQQRQYMKCTEQFFGNGPRNPAIKLAVNSNKSHRAFDEWCGVSSFINERSTLEMTIKDEPFYTFFNIGNGKFFNWKGERVSNNPWYSLGVQDYMPTWHFWTAPTWLNKNVTAGTTKLNVGFTWDDAYFGGSCLKVSGTTSKEYLHLFKTKFTVANGQKITVRYKLVGGQGAMRLVVGGMNGSENTRMSTFKILTLDECSDAADKGFTQGPDSWVTKTFNLTTANINSTYLNGGAIGILGIEFTDAENLEVLLGELSINTSANTTTPVAPTIRSAKVLNSTYTGVDGKLIWTMDGDVARKAGTPKYNSDVNTSMFKIYAQEEGGAEEFCGVTTSWAGFAFRATNTSDSKKIRFGVSAVSADTKTESAITWSQYFSKPGYVASSDIEINKHMVKPNEAFKISYVDPKHASSTWKIKNTAGTVVASGTGTSISVTNGLSTVGGYDLVIDEGTTNARTFGYYVQVTDEKVGAVPQIKKVTVNGSDITSASASTMKVQLTDHPVMGYEGRACDGNASRGISLNNGYIGANIGDLGLSNSAYSPFTIAGWFYFKAIPDLDWNFMNVSNKTASWPQNTWGWAWNHGHPDGTISCVFRGNSSDDVAPGELHYEFPNTKLEAGVWTHIAWICDFNSSKAFRNQLYINGVKQNSTWFRYRSTRGGSKDYTGTTDDYCPNVNGQVTLGSSDWAYFGGAAHQGSSIDGFVDDFQIWGKAMTADEVKQSMNGLTKSSLPSSVIAFWDFEDNCQSDYGFTAAGTKAGVKAYNYVMAYIDNNPEKGGTYGYMEPFYVTGCPFLSGTAYPIKTTATWTDKNDRLTQFAKRTVSRAELSEAEGGEAVVTFARGGDHVITLKLENDYGVATTDGSDEETQFSFPVIEVPTITAIDGIDADAEGVITTAEGRTVFFDFAEAGEYQVEAYNMAGLCVAAEQLNATAGQRATVTMGASGVYLIKIVKNGVALRTIKLMVK